MEFMDLMKQWLDLREEEKQWRASAYEYPTCKKMADDKLAKMLPLEEEINCRMRGEL